MINLRSINIPNADLINAIKVVLEGESPKLFYSTQRSNSSATPSLRIRAVKVDDPASSQDMLDIPLLLPAKIGWDVYGNEEGKYEWLLEEAGGAINSLVHKNGGNIDTEVSSPHPFESFSRPHFTRTQRGHPQAAAISNSRNAVVFPATAFSSATPYIQLIEAADAIVGIGKRHWVLVKKLVGGHANLNVSPGRLNLSAWTPQEGAANAAAISIPDLVAFEFDATNLLNDVLVFATSKPSVLLEISAAAKTIQLDAPVPGQLNKLSSPSIAIGAQQVHIAAIADPGTSAATVLYGTFSIDSLQ